MNREDSRARGFRKVTSVDHPAGSPGMSGATSAGAEQGQHPVELVEACVMQGQGAATLFVLDGDAQP
jgi:hypothetical protein